MLWCVVWFSNMSCCLDSQYVLRVKTKVPVLHASFMDRLGRSGLNALSAIGLFVIDKSGVSYFIQWI